MSGFPRISLAATSAKVGDMEVLSVSDGNLILPAPCFLTGIQRPKLKAFWLLSTSQNPS